jgi:hypothetical protein
VNRVSMGAWGLKDELSTLPALPQLKALARVEEMRLHHTKLPGRRQTQRSGCRTK